MSSLFVFIAILFLASCSLGGAWQSIDATSEYLKDRVAFGEPLANFQVINIYYLVLLLRFTVMYVDCFSQCLGLVVNFLQIIS